MFIVTYNSARYVSTSPAEAIAILKGLCKHHHRLAKQFREEATKNLNSGLTQQNWVHNNKAYRTYRNLIAYLKTHPEDSPVILKALAAKTFGSQVKALQKSGIDIEAFSPGEGAYKGLNLWPKMTPPTPEVMPLPNEGTRYNGR